MLAEEQRLQAAADIDFKNLVRMASVLVDSDFLVSHGAVVFVGRLFVRHLIASIFVRTAPPTHAAVSFFSCTRTVGCICIICLAVVEQTVNKSAAWQLFPQSLMGRSVSDTRRPGNLQFRLLIQSSVPTCRLAVYDTVIDNGLIWPSEFNNQSQSPCRQISSLAFRNRNFAKAAQHPKSFAMPCVPITALAPSRARLHLHDQ